MSLSLPEQEKKPGRVGRALVLYGLLPAALIGLALAYNSLVDYVQNDPGFCTQCHETQTQYVLWTKGEHHNIVCQSCHHETRKEALDVLRKFVLEGKSGDELIKGEGGHDPKVPVDSCAHCHLSHDRNWPQVGGSIGHRVHVTKAGVSCLRCHARSIHKFRTARDACVECHEQQVRNAKGMERLHCLGCHNFLSREETMKPSRRVCLDCHRSSGILDPDFPQNAPMARLACWGCHLPHAPSGPSQVPCASCHDQMERHGLHSVPDHQRCIDCHAPHTWKTERASCLQCHDDKTDHNPGKDCWSCHSMTLTNGGEP